MVKGSNARWLTLCRRMDLIKWSGSYCLSYEVSFTCFGKSNGPDITECAVLGCLLFLSLTYAVLGSSLSVRLSTVTVVIN